MKKRFVGLLVLLALLSIPVAIVISRQATAVGGSGQSVAIVQLNGEIRDASSDSLSSPPGARSVLEHLANAREDGRIAAVVLRINSPGGTAGASQEIHRAITKLKEAGKPVVVSMGDIAASGAYYVATAADRIIANPGTITGSIGVYIQFLKAADLAEKYGVELVNVKSGPYKDFDNPTQPLTDDDRAMLQNVVDNSLDQFVAAIAEGRQLPEEDVRRIADGRILTGEQAKNLGLIDDFGGLDDAIRLAAELAGIEGEPTVVRFRNPVPWYARYLPVNLGRALPQEIGEHLLPYLLERHAEPKLMY